MVLMAAKNTPSPAESGDDDHEHGKGGHNHSYNTATGAHRRRLALVLGITLTVMFAEVIGAIWSGSLALLADAGHMLTDSAGIAIALFASWLAAKPATSQRTFGWLRAEILAALANALLLLVISVLVIVEGLQRIFTPAEEIDSGVMIVVAAVGLLANLVSLFILARGQSESLNVRGAYLEVMGDAIGSVMVIASGIVIAATGFMPADGIASVMIGLLVAPRAWSLLREVAHVLLEAAPVNVDLEKLRNHIMGIDDVIAVHDLHVWTITSGVPVMSAHVVVPAEVLDHGGAQGILDSLRDCLSGHFDVDHSTFQIESPQMRARESGQTQSHL